jgi:hypothetical protein
VDHERAQVRLEGIEIGVAVEQVAPVRDGVGCDETVDGLADGNAEPPQCAGVASTPDGQAGVLQTRGGS